MVSWFTTCQPSNIPATRRKFNLDANKLLDSSGQNFIQLVLLIQWIGQLLVTQFTVKRILCSCCR